MEANMSEQDRSEKKIKSQSEKKAQRPSRYLVSRVQENNADQPKEVATTSSISDICKKEVVNFKGHCEKHCTKGCCVNLQIFWKEDCNKECCKNTELAKKCKNLCCSKCGEDCFADDDHYISCCMCDDRAISGNSEEDLAKEGVKNNSQMKKDFDSVLEEMKAKFDEKDEKSKQEKENTEAMTSISEKLSTASEERKDVLTYNLWYEKSSSTNKNTKKAPKASKDNNDKEKAASDVNVSKSWRSTKVPSKSEDNTNSEDSNSIEDPDNFPSKDNPKSASLSSTKQEINHQDESCLRRVLYIILQFFTAMFHAVTPGNSENSYFHRFINFFYGIFQRGRVEAEIMPVQEHSPAHLPNPEEAAFIPPARRNPPRRRSPRAARKE